MNYPNYIWTWFIDPYLRQIHALQVPKEISAWHQALEVDCLDMGKLDTRINGHHIQVWVDDVGMLRKPPLVTFELEGRLFPGYGLVFEGNDSGDTLSVSFDKDFLIHELWLGFDPEWEKRLGAANYFSQLTRVIDWEKWHAPVKTNE